MSTGLIKNAFLRLSNNPLAPNSGNWYFAANKLFIRNRYDPELTVNDAKYLAILVRSSGFGEGEPDLGEKLLKSFMQMLSESGTFPDRMIFMNSGIFLTTEGTPILGLLKKFNEAGTEILTCATCLDYYGRQDKLIIGQPTNMRDTVSALLEFNKVLTI